MADHLVVKNSSVSSDALIRAWRTFYTAVGLDILLLLGAGLSSLLDSGVDVTSGAFWASAGVLAIKSILTGVATYLLRLKVTPKNETDMSSIGEPPTRPDFSPDEELGTSGLEVSPESDYDARGHSERYP